jgi:hypothetical protein
MLDIAKLKLNTASLVELGLGLSLAKGEFSNALHGVYKTIISHTKQLVSLTIYLFSMDIFY